MTPFLSFVLGLLLGLAVAGAFVVFGYKLARAHEQQMHEYNALTSRDCP